MIYTSILLKPFGQLSLTQSHKNTSGTHIYTHEHSFKGGNGIFSFRDRSEPEFEERGSLGMRHLQEENT